MMQKKYDSSKNSRNTSYYSDQNSRSFNKIIIQQWIKFYRQNKNKKSIYKRSLSKAKTFKLADAVEVILTLEMLIGDTTESVQYSYQVQRQQQSYLQKMVEWQVSLSPLNHRIIFNHDKYIQSSVC